MVFTPTHYVGKLSFGSVLIGKVCKSENSVVVEIFANGLCDSVILDVLNQCHRNKCMKDKIFGTTNFFFHS